MSNLISYRRESISGCELLYPVLALWALSLENAFSGKTDVGENLLVRRDSISRAFGNTSFPISPKRWPMASWKWIGCGPLISWIVDWIGTSIVASQQAPILHFVAAM